MVATLRAVGALAAITVVSLILIPVQWLAVRFGWPMMRRIPVVFHRFVLARLGVRVRAHGAASAKRPLILAPNHISWLDIPLLSSLAPVSFVAKSEVGIWPVIGLFARLQRSVFIDRKRRHDTGRVTSEVAGRLAAGDAIVMFLEGTSSEGNGVLPYRSALLGAARQVIAGTNETVQVQPVAIAYTRVQGLPMGRHQRPLVAWVGDVEMAGHLWGVLKEGAIDVDVWFGEPVAFGPTTDRKALAAGLQRAVAGAVARLNAGRPPDWAEPVRASAGGADAARPAEAETPAPVQAA